MSERDRATVAHFDWYAQDGRWDQLYDPANPTSHGFLARRRCSIELLGDLEGKRVLDLGCGTGALIPVLATIPGVRYLGLDAAPNMVAESANLVSSLGLESTFEAKVSDVQALDLPDASFDGVVGMGLVEYFDDPLPLLREACRVCAPGGRVVFTIPRRGSLDDRIVRASGAIRSIVRRFLGERRDVPRSRMTPGEFRGLFDGLPVRFDDDAFYNKLVLPYPFTRFVPEIARAVARGVEERDGFDAFATGYIAAFRRDG